jgi:ankyrin repeat protein
MTAFIRKIKRVIRCHTLWCRDNTVRFSGGFDVHNDAGMTPLHLAITTGSLEAASVLLSLRRNDKAKIENDDVSQHEAPNTRPTADLREFLSISRYPNIGRGYSFQPSHGMSRLGHNPVVDLSSEAKVEPNTRTIKGFYSPFTSSILNRQIQNSTSMAQGHQEVM